MADPTNTETEEKELPPAVTLLSEIAKNVKAADAEVREKVVQSRINKEINSRVEALDKALGLRASMQNNIRKLERPDVKTFNTDGSVASASLSATQYKELKQAKEKIGKVDKAIKLALGGDYSKLNELKG
jgi:phenylalanyl-tRNA synthetase beta subunit